MPTPEKNVVLLQNIKEFLDDLAEINFSLEIVERNERHILKHFEPRLLHLVQGLVFFARGFPVFARLGTFLLSLSAVISFEDSRGKCSVGIPIRRPKMSSRGHF